MGEMNKILRWVKASERLPEKPTKDMIFRVSGLPWTKTFFHETGQWNGEWFGGDHKGVIDKAHVEWLEETEPVNRLSEIVGKWPGDESAEEIIEGIKGEPQTNEGVTEVDTFEELRKISFIVWNNDGFQGSVNQSREISKEIHQQFIEPLQKQVKELEQRNKLLEVPDQEFNEANRLKAQISSLQSEIERLKKQP